MVAIRLMKMVSSFRCFCFFFCFHPLAATLTSNLDQPCAVCVILERVVRHRRKILKIEMRMRECPRGDLIRTFTFWWWPSLPPTTTANQMKWNQRHRIKCLCMANGHTTNRHVWIPILQSFGRRKRWHWPERMTRQVDKLQLGNARNNKKQNVLSSSPARKRWKKKNYKIISTTMKWQKTINILIFRFVTRAALWPT